MIYAAESLVDIASAALIYAAVVLGSTLTVLSSEQETRLLPSGAKRMQRTVPVCPFSTDERPSLFAAATIRLVVLMLESTSEWAIAGQNSMSLVVVGDLHCWLPNP